MHTHSQDDQPLSQAITDTSSAQEQQDTLVQPPAAGLAWLRDRCRRFRWLLIGIATALVGVALWSSRDATVMVWLDGQLVPCPKRFLIPLRERHLGGNMMEHMDSPATGSRQQLGILRYAIHDLGMVLIVDSKGSGSMKVCRDFPYASAFTPISQPALAIFQWESATKWGGAFVPDAAVVADRRYWIGSNKLGFTRGNDVCVVFKDWADVLRICYLTREKINMD